MPDNCPYRPIVVGIVFISTEERGLKYSCRERNVVVRKVVSCINGIGIHVPFVPVNGLIYRSFYKLIVFVGCDIPHIFEVG